jgi:hypothetical protein
LEPEWRLVTQGPLTVELSILGSDTARSALCLQEEAEHADPRRSAYLHQERAAV